MTEQNQSERTRRTFMKGAAATGVAATGITAFTGSAAGQEVEQADLDIRSVSRDIFRQGGNQQGAGLVVVQVQNLAVDIIDNVTVTIGGDVVDIGDINVLNNNIVKINVTDVIDVTQNQVQVAVTLLGQTVQGQDFEGSTTETINVRQ